MQNSGSKARTVSSERRGAMATTLTRPKANTTKFGWGGAE